MFSTAFKVLALAATVKAHLFISSPTPIEGSAPKDPLDASGSNFPCHGVALPSSGGQKMAAGSSQLLAFDTGDGANTAVHGGGSCQISITYETDAEKVKDPKNWYVIYSIEGGCPSNTYQNLDGSYQGPQGTYTGSYPCSDPKTNGVDCVNSFQFNIPKGVKSGHAIMAWSWFNTVGNREMYQNCVNTELTGGDGSEMSDFPSMFVANMASVDQCPTTQSMNLKFPFPGKYTTTKKPSGSAAATAKQFPMALPSGSSCSSDGAPAGGAAAGASDSGSGAQPSSGAAASAAPATSAAASAAQSAQITQQTNAAASSGSGGNAPVTVTTMQTVTSGAAGAIGSSAAAPNPVASSAPAAVGSSAPAGTGSSSSGSSGSCASGGVSCSNPGSVVCIGTTQFGICDVNNCATPQALAAGTQCSGGVIGKRSHVRHARRHVGLGGRH